MLNEAMEASGVTTEDVDHLLLHQANIRIMETVAKRLGVPMEKVVTNLKKVRSRTIGLKIGRSSTLLNNQHNQH